ncbi:MAG: hypothetical protein RL386_824 [Bacteroidota bacterium]
MLDYNEVSWLAERHFGVAAAVVVRMSGEVDFNFHLKDHSGTCFLLKIANPDTALELLEMQNAAMAHLACQDWGLCIPRPLPNLAGEFITKFETSAGKSLYARLLTWVPGRPLAEVNPHTPALLFDMGSMLGQLSRALADFSHPAAHRSLKWDPSGAVWTRPRLIAIGEVSDRALAGYFLELFENEALPLLSGLRQGINYGDANDYNILVTENPYDLRVPGVIDFGDMVYSHTVNELAIALAYIMMHKADPIGAALPVIRGYHAKFPLTGAEVQALFPLVGARLLISVTCSAINLIENPENTYLQISDLPAWELLRKLRQIPPRFAWYAFRHACGWEPCPMKKAFTAWATANPAGLSALMPLDLSGGDVQWLDLGVGSPDLGTYEDISDPQKLDDRVQAIMREGNYAAGLGHYDEVRPLYTTDQFTVEGNEGPGWRSVHIGIDVFMPAGTPVYAPFAGVVHSLANNAGERDYGPTIILEHRVDDDLTFFTLYGHLDETSIGQLQCGQQIASGQPLCRIGPRPENGNWPPHLHFQVILDMLGKKGDFPGVAFPEAREIWTSICPDPWLLLYGVASPLVKQEQIGDLLERRRQSLPANLSVSYQKPLHIVRGFGPYLYDADARRYLDTVNNVAHVGHEHPRVVRAGQRQMAVLNTNTRYLHPAVITFAEALRATLPPPLEVVFFVNSGSEANELAMRLAKTFTGRRDMMVVEVGYHGNTNACVEVSAYKFNGPGGKGAPAHVHVLPIPDAYRGIYRGEGPDVGIRYASHLSDQIRVMREQGKEPAAFLCESVISCGGQIPLPVGYWAEAFQIARAAGAVCIADEVQTGFGRAGEHFWAFEAQGVVPDIVTMGKPIGNGHPIGAVATTREIADAFHNGMEYFNTFGGNPVSSAIGLEVLRVIQEEGLQQNAARTGAYLRAGLRTLQQQFPIIGDVRGPGLFCGFELVAAGSSLQPAPVQTAYLANRMRELGILMSTDGPYHNVLKIKPPMVFTQKEADFLLMALGRVLREDAMQPRV